MAVATGQSQRCYSGVGIFITCKWYFPSSTPSNQHRRSAYLELKSNATDPCCTARLFVEPNRAKPPDGGPFVPVRHLAKSKIAPFCQTARARVARLLAQSGHAYFLWVTALVQDFMHPGKISVIYGGIPVFPLVLTLLWVQLRNGGSDQNSRRTFLWQPAAKTKAHRSDWA